MYQFRTFEAEYVTENELFDPFLLSKADLLIFSVPLTTDLWTTFQVLVPSDLVIGCGTLQEFLLDVGSLQ